MQHLCNRESTDHSNNNITNQPSRICKSKLLHLIFHYLCLSYRACNLDSKNVEMSFELALQLSEGREVNVLYHCSGRHFIDNHSRSQLPLLR